MKCSDFVRRLLFFSAPSERSSSERCLEKARTRQLQSNIRQSAEVRGHVVAANCSFYIMFNSTIIIKARYMSPNLSLH